MQTEKTITLKQPVKVGDNSYEGFVLREPTGGEISKFFKASAKEGDWDGGMLLVSLVADVDLEIVRRAPASNVQEAIDFCANFLIGGQATGEPLAGG